VYEKGVEDFWNLLEDFWNLLDVVINILIILRNCTTSVLSQKRRGEEKTHVGWVSKADMGFLFTTSFLGQNRLGATP